MTKPVGKLVYLASPYTHENPDILIQRFHEAVDCCGWLMNNVKNTCFYSPIAHTHPIALRCQLPIFWEFWKQFDECMLSRCSEIWVLKIDGWDKSTGVKAELEIARKFGLPVVFIHKTENGYQRTISLDHSDENCFPTHR